MVLQKSKSIEADLEIASSLTRGQKDAADDDFEAPQLSLGQKIKVIFSNITVEPIMVCYVLPSVMASLSAQNLNLEKACRVNLDYNETICDAMRERNASGYEEEHEIEVQKLVASMATWKHILHSLVPAILLMFLGSWSDRHNKRKPVIMLPIIGEVLATTGLILCTFFFYQLPMEINGIAEVLPPSITGGWFAMFVGVYSYISSLSSPETRTVRIGAVTMFSNVSVTIGIALSGILYKQIDFYGVFFLALAMYAVGLIYGHYVVKEVPNVVENKRGFFVDFFDGKHIKDTVEVAFKSGENNRKKKICTVMVLVMVIIGPLHGELEVMYLFVRYKFKWDELDYSFYSTYNFLINICGTMFSLLFFSKYLQLDDTWLGIISSMSKILSSFIYAFAPNPTIFCLGAIVEMFNGTSFIAMRSIMSKLVPADELGKINSLFGVCESLMPLLYGPMYSQIYRMTINVFPGTFFVLGGILTLPAVFIFLWLYFEDRKDIKLNNKKTKVPPIIGGDKEEEALKMIPEEDCIVK